MIFINLKGIYMTKIIDWNLTIKRANDFASKNLAKQFATFNHFVT